MFTLLYKGVYIYYRLLDVPPFLMKSVEDDIIKMESASMLIEDSIGFNYNHFNTASREAGSSLAGK